jgi:glutathione synthase/RimK-type ligase-like ATP-grasp enzyme
MLVLILAEEGDEHAMHVQVCLKKQGCDARFLDSRWFPSSLEIAYDPVAGWGTLGMSGGKPIDFGEIHAVYWRSYGGVGGELFPNAAQSHNAANDARSLFESLLVRLPCKWVNGWRAFQLHQTKPVQLSMVAELGVVAVPATLLANSPEAVRQFAREHPRTIFKPVQGGSHTRRLTDEHLTDANLKNLALAPITLQEEVPGTNVRVFVAGERVLACRIDAYAIDFRDTADPKIVAHDLPDTMCDVCRQIARTLDLVWTGIDFRLTPDGRYVFLEANPSPMFLGFEEQTGLPLSSALADVLLTS